METVEKYDKYFERLVKNEDVVFVTNRVLYKLFGENI